MNTHTLAFYYATHRYTGPRKFASKLYLFVYKINSDITHTVYPVYRLQIGV